MLDALFKPKSVAIIGASNNPFSIGHIVMQNLLDHNFKGPIYPINPNYPEVQGLRAYKSILDVGGEVDLALIVLPSTSNVIMRTPLCLSQVLGAGHSGCVKSRSHRRHRRASRRAACSLMQSSASAKLPLLCPQPE